jgi:hypothetical protein
MGGKMPTMSCQAIIRDKRNEELKAIFDCSKGILEHMGTTFGALLGVIVGRDSMGT